MSWRVVLQENGQLVVQGVHQGGPVVSTVGPSGHLEPRPLADLCEEVEADGARVLVLRVQQGAQDGAGQASATEGGGTVLDVTLDEPQGRNGRMEALRRQLEAAREAGYADGLAEGRQGAPVALAENVGLAGWAEVYQTPPLLRALGYGAAGVVGAAGMGVILAGWWAGKDGAGAAFLWGLGVNAVYAAHLGAQIVLDLRRKFRYWTPLKGADGRPQLRVGPGGGVEVKATKANHEEWRPVGEFAAFKVPDRPPADAPARTGNGPAEVKELLGLIGQVWREGALVSDATGGQHGAGQARRQRTRDEV